MLLTAAVVVLLIGLFTQSDGWGGFGILVYLLSVAVAVVGWGLNVAAAALPAISGWRSVLLTLVTGPLEIPMWQSFTVATILLFAVAGTADTESSTSSDTADSNPSSSDSAGVPDVEELPGIGEQKGAALRDAGYEDADDIVAATKSELTTVDGIGTGLAARVLASVEDRDTNDENQHADHENQHTDNENQHTDDEKTRLVAGLEATSERIETLAETGEVAEANDRLPAARAAVSETRETLNTLSSDRDLRLRVNDVEDRLDAIPSESEARHSKFTELIETGDAHVTKARDAIEDGEVYQGLRACEAARSAYEDAQRIKKKTDEIPANEKTRSIKKQLDTLESLTDRLHEEKQVQQVETAIEKLGQQVDSAPDNDSAQDPQKAANSAVEDAANALTHLPDETDSRDLQRRITKLHEQVSGFEEITEQLTARSLSASPNTDSDDTPAAQNNSEKSAAKVPTQADTKSATESVDPGQTSGATQALEIPSSVVRTVDEITDTAELTDTVMLQIRERLSESGRRSVFRANTVSGESVQLDVWNRHVSELTLEPDDWYVFDAVRGQHWTVDGTSGVTISTTPNVTITKHGPTPDHKTTTTEQPRR